MWQEAVTALLFLPVAVELITAYPGSFSDRNLLAKSGQKIGAVGGSVTEAL